MTPTDKPRIYCWINQRTGLVGDAFYHVLAMDEHGVVLAQHTSSSPAWARHDIGVGSESKHDRYREAHPDGYELVWLKGGAEPRNVIHVRDECFTRESAEAMRDTEPPPPRTTASATIAVLTDFARADLRRSIEQLHALGWRLTTAGGDTVDRLALIHLTTGERMPVWSKP